MAHWQISPEAGESLTIESPAGGTIVFLIISSVCLLLTERLFKWLC
tara:strand:+ start:4180 stop:4317 length:138 start_codon:yes stop_codon:yes gene_type:complete